MSQFAHNFRNIISLTLDQSAYLWRLIPTCTLVHCILYTSLFVTQKQQQSQFNRLSLLLITHDIQTSGYKMRFIRGIQTGKYLAMGLDTPCAYVHVCPELEPNFFPSDPTIILYHLWLVGLGLLGCFLCTSALQLLGKNADLPWLPMCVSMTTLQEATARHFCTEIYQWK